MDLIGVPSATTFFFCKILIEHFIDFYKHYRYQRNTLDCPVEPYGQAKKKKKKFNKQFNINIIFFDSLMSGLDFVHRQSGISARSRKN